MNRNLLHIVLKHADGLTVEADTDAILLRRFVAARDESAFPVRTAACPGWVDHAPRRKLVVPEWVAGAVVRAAGECRTVV